MKILAFYALWFMATLGACFLIDACTGQQVKDTTGVVKVVAPGVPAPAGPVVAIAAEQVDSAVTAYLTAHPEKLGQKLGWDDWAKIGGSILTGIAGLNLFRNQTRAKDIAAAVTPTPPAVVKV